MLEFKIPYKKVIYVRGTVQTGLHIEEGSVQFHSAEMASNSAVFLRG